MRLPCGATGCGNRCFSATESRSLFRGMRLLITLPAASRS